MAIVRHHAARYLAQRLESRFRLRQDQYQDQYQYQDQDQEAPSSLSGTRMETLWKRRV
jgi:hypothetical protein